LVERRREIGEREKENLVKFNACQNAFSMQIKKKLPPPLKGATGEKGGEKFSW
jgi:hypothetical protein